MYYLIFQQLKGHLQTLDELRQQVRAADLASFDQLTDGLREDIHTAVQDYRTATAGMGEGGRASPPEWGVAGGGDKEEEEEAGGAEGSEQALQGIHRTADHYQSLEDLQSVGFPCRRTKIIIQRCPFTRRGALTGLSICSRQGFLTKNGSLFGGSHVFGVSTLIQELLELNGLVQQLNAAAHVRCKSCDCHVTQ